LALDAPSVWTRAASLTDIGENELRMVTLQRPQNFADGRRDRHRDDTPALAGLANLPRWKIDLRPAQKALFEPQSRGAGEGEERRIVGAGLGFEPAGLVVG